MSASQKFFRGGLAAPRRSEVEFELRIDADRHASARLDRYFAALEFAANQRARVDGDGSPGGHVAEQRPRDVDGFGLDVALDTGAGTDVGRPGDRDLSLELSVNTHTPVTGHSAGDARSRAEHALF